MWGKPHVWQLWCDPNKNPGPQHPTNHERSLSSSSKGWFWGVLRASSWLLLATPIRTLGVYLHSWSILQHLRFQKRLLRVKSLGLFFLPKKGGFIFITTNLPFKKKTPSCLLVFFQLCSSTGVPPVDLLEVSGFSESMCHLYRASQPSEFLRSPTHRPPRVVGQSPARDEARNFWWVDGSLRAEISMENIYIYHWEGLRTPPQTGCRR